MFVRRNCVEEHDGLSTQHRPSDLGLDPSLPTVEIMADAFAILAVTCPKGGRDVGSKTTWLSDSVHMAPLYQIVVAGLCQGRKSSYSITYLSFYCFTCSSLAAQKLRTDGALTEKSNQDEIVTTLDRWADQVPTNLGTAN